MIKYSWGLHPLLRTCIGKNKMVCKILETFYQECIGSHFVSNVNGLTSWPSELWSSGAMNTFDPILKENKISLKGSQVNGILKKNGSSNGYENILEVYLRNVYACLWLNHGPYSKYVFPSTELNSIKSWVD